MDEPKGAEPFLWHAGPKDTNETNGMWTFWAPAGRPPFLAREDLLMLEGHVHVTGPLVTFSSVEKKEPGGWRYNVVLPDGTRRRFWVLELELSEGRDWVLYFADGASDTDAIMVAQGILAGLARYMA